jgi:hypothetical protein
MFFLPIALRPLKIGFKRICEKIKAPVNQYMLYVIGKKYSKRFSQLNLDHPIYTEYKYNPIE